MHTDKSREILSIYSLSKRSFFVLMAGGQSVSSIVSHLFLSPLLEATFFSYNRKRYNIDEKVKCRREREEKEKERYELMQLYAYTHRKEKETHIDNETSNRVLVSSFFSRYFD